ncbi:Dpy-30 motif family protein [Trichomonas vaginalis G3]|uniref:Dpy-30 motif family protein n=1 Tax=Trichomonas vaginalis (strain ATCC PRA-98 / G3) TaxID=412133 RepID=A2E9R5_TRIV3|nr:adenylate kinase protein [Trichomonas vaginalis G3]EAY10600.1 Dpy-30 motif family protein [Trichomonas vaginalis G3]KAI5540852.1 adenylate kinase protein [Trichomonas vaginalis G3]|eukprot:XP_001322823.1 Dpy-30 motif family protein [Trichomonas vaginalis G3]
MSDEEDKEPQPSDFKIFVNNRDSYVGSAVTAYLTKKGFVVYGNGKNENLVNIKDLNVDDKEQVKTILSENMLVFDMTEETESTKFALDFIANATLNREINLVIFSPLLCWGGRSLKNPEEEEEKKEDEPEDKPEETEEKHEEEEETEKEPFTPVNEEDYLKRIPHELVKEQYILESRAIQLGHELERLKVTIFGVGLLYGRGENILNPFFRALWEGKMNEFPVTKSHISCIHVMNLGVAISKLLLEPPEEDSDDPKAKLLPKYHILGEENCPTFKAIGKAFSKVLANGKVREFNEDIPELHKGILNTELAAESTFLGESEDIVCQAGIIESAAKVVDEFRSKYGLTPLKVLVIGPPGSGYPEVCHKISERMKLPFIDPLELVGAATKEQGEFGDEIRGMMEENEGAINDEIICKVAHRRMAARDCRNYGWAISGFADTFAKAGEIFDHGEEEEASPHFEHIPTHVVVLTADDKVLEKHQAVNSDDSESFKKALRKYRKANEAEEDVFKFFDDRSISSIIVPAFHPNNLDEIFKFLGEPHFFGRPQEEIDAEIAEAERIEKEKKEVEAKAKEEQLVSEERNWENGEAIHDIAVKRMEEEDNKFLGEKSALLQKYLDDEVMQHVLAGIVQVCKDMPEDPVDALAEFLFAENRRMKH